MSTTVHCPSYTAPLFDPIRFEGICAWAVRKTRESMAQAIAASGHSGLPVASVVAHELHIPLVAVRQDVNTHDSRTVNGILPAQATRYAIIDDLLVSGSTAERIVREIAKVFPTARATHLFLWHPYEPTGSLADLEVLAPGITCIKARCEELGEFWA